MAERYMAFCGPSAGCALLQTTESRIGERIAVMHVASDFNITSVQCTTRGRTPEYPISMCAGHNCSRWGALRGCGYMQGARAQQVVERS
jgi:hypothetical protein